MPSDRLRGKRASGAGQAKPDAEIDILKIGKEVDVKASRVPEDVAGNHSGSAGRGERRMPWLMKISEWLTVRHLIG